MAIDWQIQGCVDSSYLVLWVIITLVSGVDSISLKQQNNIEESLSLSNPREIEYTRIKRSDKEVFPPIAHNVDPVLSNIEVEDLPEATRQDDNKSSAASEGEVDPDIHKEEKKTKQNSKQHKYVEKELKNYSSNKGAVDGKHSNETLNEKQKNAFYGPQGYMLKYSSNKKETKTDANNHDFDSTLKNVSTPFISNEDSSELKPDEHYNDASKVTKSEGEQLNETSLMSDQPMGGSQDLSHNTTNITDDDSFDDLPTNTTDVLDERNKTTSPNGRTMPAPEGMDVLLISGISMGTVVILGLVAGGGYVVYRHRLWNKPQTLSDKCSNADSSGYIDDSTLRENSEEMYSLDNDSFLNSLEAMTIQNYWTDNVKHTKL